MKKRELILRIFEGDLLLYKSRGLNHAVITDLMLLPDPTGKKDLFIEARFDLNEWPEAVLESKYTKDLRWNL